ncbi:MAG: nuclear transport factor 2 family protein [Novosphingobium sp.]
MSIELPTPVAAYFAADKTKSAELVASCFTPSAVVTDEGRDFAGRDAIRAWKATASKTYSYTVEPRSIVKDSGMLIVTGHLEGDFPGSPVDLRYIFTLEGEKIAALEIVP